MELQVIDQSVRGDKTKYKHYSIEKVLSRSGKAELKIAQEELTSSIMDLTKLMVNITEQFRTEGLDTDSLVNHTTNRYVTYYNTRQLLIKILESGGGTLQITEPDGYVSYWSGFDEQVEFGLACASLCRSAAISKSEVTETALSQVNAMQENRKVSEKHLKELIKNAIAENGLSNARKLGWQDYFMAGDYVVLVSQSWNKDTICYTDQKVEVIQAKDLENAEKYIGGYAENLYNDLPNFWKAFRKK